MFSWTTGFWLGFEGLLAKGVEHEADLPGVFLEERAPAAHPRAASRSGARGVRLSEPAARFSLALEAGWSKGAGKHLVVHVAGLREPDLMYKIADVFTTRDDELLDALSKPPWWGSRS